MSANTSDKLCISPRRRNKDWEFHLGDGMPNRGPSSLKKNEGAVSSKTRTTHPCLGFTSCKYLLCVFLLLSIVNVVDVSLMRVSFALHNNDHYFPASSSHHAQICHVVSIIRFQYYNRARSKILPNGLLENCTIQESISQQEQRFVYLSLMGIGPVETRSSLLFRTPFLLVSSLI